MTLDRIHNRRWRSDAQAEVDEARVRYMAWAEGTRSVPVREALNYQIESLKGTTKEVRAVHLALDPEGLGRWSNPQKGFSKLVDAYRNLAPSIKVRRILVLDAENDEISSLVDGKRTIIDPQIAEVCRSQILPRPHGLGAELRIHWTRPADRDLTDLLVLDDEETCSIQSLGRDRFAELVACINAATVAAQVRRFENLWTSAVDVQFCLEEVPRGALPSAFAKAPDPVGEASAGSVLQ